MNDLLRPDEIRSLINYVPETGEMFWRSRPADLFPQKSSRSPSHSAGIWNARYAGAPALNCRYRNGYLGGKIFKGRTYLRHRVAWCIEHGEWPSDQIDHINRDRADNRIANLRLSDRSLNAMNRGPGKGSASAYKGVFKQSGRSGWFSQFTFKGECKYVGTFSTEEDAALAYDKAVFAVHGDKNSLNFPDHDWLPKVADMLAGEVN